MICRACNQPVNVKDLVAGAYCSYACKGLVNGNTRILVGNYYGITPINQSAEIERRLKIV